MADPLYSAAAPDCLIVTELDEVSGIYHRASGMTHIVIEPVPEIILALQQQHLSVTGLLDQLGVAANADALAGLTTRLEELEASGLISRT